MKVVSMDVMHDQRYNATKISTELTINQLSVFSLYLSHHNLTSIYTINYIISAISVESNGEAFELKDD